MSQEELNKLLAQHPLVYYVTAPKEPPRTTATVYIVASALIVVLLAAIGGVFYVGPEQVMARIVGTKPTAQPIMALPLCK